jgi:alkylation response protein AidB-like acyl-CoA dehydrogenase
MTFTLNEEQRLLRDQVRELLSRESSPDSLRQTIDAGLAWNEPLWRKLAELGFLGAGIPEELGGVGLGPFEVAVLAQEIGRAVAPTPFMSSVCLAAEALMIAGTPAQQSRWLPGLASGDVIGCFAWTEGNTAPEPGLIETALVGDRLNGRKSPVADCAIAQICVVAALIDGEPGLALVELDQPGVSRRPLRGIDQLRRFDALSFENAAAAPMNAIAGADALAGLLDRAAIYKAFEQIGGAEAALQMACDYTRQRFIFGRPLASYQAIKHRLADDYAEIELASCNALQAARLLADGAPVAAAAATARIGATTAYERIARDNLQFHGGIGFTWEADCHFHYRRARTLALDIGSVEFWSDRLVTALQSDDDGAPARAWLAKAADTFKVTSPHWETEEGAALAKRWAAAKHAAGYSAIVQPREFGGAGGTLRQQQIFGQEEAAAGLAMPLGGMGFHQAMAAITKHGTPEQRRKWEGLTYAGEIYWCQLFSEPGAGSDLAAVRTSAVRRGDKWIVNGQKVWTSGGHLADYGVLLARTDPEATKHKGLSFFIIDMRQPGVTTRPIRQINGQTGFTETFFVDAEALDAERLDEVGAGWAVAMSVLAVERTTTKNISAGDKRQSATSARNLIRLAKAARRGRGSALDSAAVRGRIAQFHAEAQGIKNFTLRLQEQLAQRGPPPLNIPVIKLTATRRVQQVQAFLMDLDEAGGIVEAADAPANQDRFYEYITSASSRIAGGADEVLRNQLAERALGLPGDLRADKDIPFNQIPQGV